MRGSDHVLSPLSQKEIMEAEIESKSGEIEMKVDYYTASHSGLNLIK